MSGVGMGKIDLPNVSARTVKGRTYYYYRLQVGGKERFTRLEGRPGSRRFLQQYKALHAPRAEKDAHAYSFNRLIASYRQSARYKRLRESSRKTYDEALDIISKCAGGVDAVSFARNDVWEMYEAFAERPRKAKSLIQLMSILMSHAVNRGWRTDNPAAKMDIPKGAGGELKAWPPGLIDAFRAEASGEMLLAFEIALMIGPRPDDLTRLRWSDYDGEAITYTQSKTSGVVWAPLLPRVRSILDVAKRNAKGLTIVADRRGRPLNYDRLEYRFRKVRAAIGGEGYSMHGWRKNATVALLEAGCTEDQVKAITGHTTSGMVQLYGRAVNRKTQAKEAVGKLARWSENRD